MNGSGFSSLVLIGFISQLQLRIGEGIGGYRSLVFNWRRGEPTFSETTILSMVMQVYDANLPLIVHCNGLAAIDNFLLVVGFESLP